MKYINLPTKQHKTITTRKIMKLRKIKKIKMKTIKTSIDNCDYGVKRVDDTTKKNESNSGISLIQQNMQRTNSLRERINNYRNRIDELIPNTADNNTNNQTNNITLVEEFEMDLFSSPLSPKFNLLSEEEFNFEKISPRQRTRFPDFFCLYEDDFERRRERRESEIFNLSSPKIFPEQDINLNELVFENLVNDRNNFSIFDYIESNRNEYNSQNGNTNNNNNHLLNINNSNGNEINRQNGNTNNNNHLYNINISNGNEFNHQNGNTNNYNNNLLNINNSNRNEFNRQNGNNNNINNSNRNEFNRQNGNGNNNNINNSNRNEFNPQNNNLLNINNSNGNEFNPQNGNANNNHPNMMHLLLYDLFHNFDDFSFRINRTEIRNIKKKLTKIKFKNTESSSGNGEKCIICYENFKKYQKIYSLPCHHLFHINCLNKEIKYRQKCPICRKGL